MTIPKDFISTIWQNSSSEHAIKLICSRFHWVTEKIIRFINESNLDCMIEICTTDPEDKDIDKRYFKLISAVKVDNLFENLTELNSPHMMLDRTVLEQNDTL